eukprot:514712_1
MKKNTEENIPMYRDKVRKLTQRNETLKKELQEASNAQKRAEMQKQDLQDLYDQQKSVLNNMQQKIQRVLNQSDNISQQIELLNTTLNKSYNHQINEQQQQQHHQRHYSNSAVHNYLDTIRRCNMRSMQILTDILEKNRKRSDGLYSLRNKRTNIGIGPTVNISLAQASMQNNNKRRSHKLYNQTGVDETNDLFFRFRSTRSTRFSDKKK